MPSIQRGSRFDGGTPPTPRGNGGGGAEASSAHGCRQTTVRHGLDRRQRSSNCCGEKTVTGFDGEGLPLYFCCIRQAETGDCRAAMLLAAGNYLRLACAAYTRMRADYV